MRTSESGHWPLATWAEFAACVGLPAAQFIAAAGALIAIPLTWRRKLQASANQRGARPRSRCRPFTTV